MRLHHRLHLPRHQLQTMLAAIAKEPLTANKQQQDFFSCYAG